MGGFAPTAGDGVLQLNGGLRIAGSASASDTTSPYIYRTSGVDNLNFATNGVERMRVDSSGNILFGTTSSTVYDDTSGSGVVIRGATGAVDIMRNNDHPLLLNRTGGDGQFTMYHRDGVNKAAVAIRGGHFCLDIPSGTEKVRITSAGNVLIGTTTAEDTTGNSGPKIIHTGDIQIDGDQKVLLFRSTNSTAQKQSGIQWWNENGAGVQCAIFGIRETVTYAKSALAFYTSDNVDSAANNGEGAITERMRIDSSGFVLIGTSSTTAHNNLGINLRPDAGILVGVNGTHAAIFSRHSSDGECVRFQKGSVDVGSIDVSGSSTSYNTSSDYRLKENAVAISDGITRLKTLKPYKFNFKVDTSTIVDGFFAHEVTAVPEAITGTKDEVDSDNNPVYQGIDQSKLVPLLTAALQEAVAKIETLETKVAALEGS